MAFTMPGTSLRLARCVSCRVKAAILFAGPLGGRWVLTVPQRRIPVVAQVI
jgi:hypothetical protein